MARILPCGDAALLVCMDTEPGGATTRRLAGIAATLHDASPQGITDIVPAFNTLTVCFDPDCIAAAAVSHMIEAAIATAGTATFEPALHDIPVRYGGEWGPDLREVSERTGLSESGVIDLHASREYTVYLLGFSPGFAYLGDIKPELQLPRKATPRPLVPSGSVAIATSYTAVYPQATAGGWHLIGRTDVTLFDVNREEPALFRPGDRVRFVPL